MVTSHIFLPDEDLSETQIYMTRQTYDRFAKEYADKWEWNPVTIREIKKYNITPFIKFVKKRGSILIVECQSGRDYSLFSEAGFTCLGVGSSFGLLSEAVQRVPQGLFVRLEPRELPFMPESFDAVYADALVHLPRRDMKDVLKDFRIFLRPGGVLYLSSHLGRANIFEQSDLGGPRYLTLWRRREIDHLVKSVGFTKLWAAESPHTDPVLPGWYSLIARRL